MADKPIAEEDLSGRVTAFWQAWQADEPRLAVLTAQELVEQGNELLHRYCEGVVLELEGAASEADGSGGKLVFSANGQVAYFPEVEGLVNAAQTRRYAVQAFRQRLDPQTLAQFDIRMQDFSLNAQDILIQAQPQDFLVDIVIGFAKEIAPDYWDHACHMAMIMLDHALGEWDFAVKIGAVDFSETAPEAAVALPAFVARLETLWEQELHHTGVYPRLEDCQYESGQIEEDGEQDGLILTRNITAAQLLGRADMAWMVSLQVHIDDKAALQAAYALEDDFSARIGLHQQGIGVLTVTNLSQGLRRVFAYCGDKAFALDCAQAAARQFPELRPSIQMDYDPSWRWYRYSGLCEEDA